LLSFIVPAIGRSGCHGTDAEPDPVRRLRRTSEPEMVRSCEPSPLPSASSWPAQPRRLPPPIERSTDTGFGPRRSSTPVSWIPAVVRSRSWTGSAGRPKPASSARRRAQHFAGRCRTPWIGRSCGSITVVLTREPSGSWRRSGGHPRRRVSATPGTARGPRDASVEASSDTTASEVRGSSPGASRTRDAPPPPPARQPDL
jgi:hypothetical protein